MITIELTPRRLFVHGNFPEKELQKTLTFVSSSLHEYQRRKEGLLKRSDEIEIAAQLAHRIGCPGDNPSDIIIIGDSAIQHKKAYNKLTEKGKGAIKSAVTAIIKGRQGADIANYRSAVARCIPSTYTLWDNKAKSCPIGLLPEVEKVLNKYQMEYKVDDTRIAPIKKYNWRLKSTTKLRDFQEEALQKTILEEGNSIGLFHWATGSGKTIGFAAITAALGLKTLIIVPSIALCQQTKDKFLEFTEITEEEIGIFNGSNKDLRPVTIAVQNSVARHLDLFVNEGFELLHVDEAHGVTAVGLFEAVDSLPCYYRFFWTGTPFRSKINQRGKLNFEGEDAMIAAVACKILDPIADYKTLRDKGYLAKVTVESVILEAEDIGFDSSTFKGGLNQVRKEFIKRGKRNEIFAKRALDRWRSHRYTTLIIVAEVSHAEDIARHLPEGVVRVLTGKTEGRNAHLNEFIAKRFGILIATSWVRQGIDIPTVDYVANMAAFHSVVDTQQKGGRSTRIGTEDMVKLDAIVEEPYDAWHPDMKRHSRARLEAYDQQGLNCPLLYKLREAEEIDRKQKMEEMAVQKEQYAERTFREILSLDKTEKAFTSRALLVRGKERKELQTRARRARLAKYSKGKQLLSMRRLLFKIAISINGNEEEVALSLLDYLSPGDQKKLEEMGGSLLVDKNITLAKEQSKHGKNWDDNTEDDDEAVAFGEDVGEISSKGVPHQDDEYTNLNRARERVNERRRSRSDPLIGLTNDEVIEYCDAHHHIDNTGRLNSAISLSTSKRAQELRDKRQDRLH